MGVDLFHWSIYTQCKLVEEWFCETQSHVIDLAELGGGVVGLLVAKLSNLPETFFAQQRKIDGRAKRNQSLVRADVGSGPFAFDVLFAGGEGQDLGALPFIINSFADETSCHFMDVLLARREEADAGSAIPHGNPQRLTVAHDNIGTHRARGFEQT